MGRRSENTNQYEHRSHETKRNIVKIEKKVKEIHPLPDATGGSVVSSGSAAICRHSPDDLKFPTVINDL